MLVIFRNDWFSPEMLHYKRGPTPQEVPDHLRDKLPSSAKVVETEAEVDTSIKSALVNETPFAPKTLAEADDERKNLDIDQSKIEQAEERERAERAERAARFKEQLRAEGSKTVPPKKAPGWAKKP